MHPAAATATAAAPLYTTLYDQFRFLPTPSRTASDTVMARLVIRDNHMYPSHGPLLSMGRSRTHAVARAVADTVASAGLSAVATASTPGTNIPVNCVSR